jgi:2-polyprenyl-6-methoxyphenol hydroxylase-like FAD-dependent oxidoreductase
MDRRKEIVILGAGIGGLTTAISLRQKGFENIHIYERRHSATTIGAGVVIWANASKVLFALNLINEIEQVGGSVNEMQRWTEKGEFIGSINIKGIDTKIGAKSFSIHRNDLQEILLQKIRELNIPVNYNHNAQQISTQKNTVSIIFGNSIEIKADIIVGADGRMNSITRKHVNKDNSPVYQNFVNWIGIVQSDKPIFKENTILDFWGCGERFGIVPINKHKGYWAGGKSLPINSTTKNENHKSYLLKLFKNWPNEIKKIIELSNQENIGHIEVYDHNPIKRWYKNNVCLLGDAAHAALPTSGQGACQAIEDAWYFASILAESQNTEHAFNEYNNTRLDKTTKIIMAGRQLAQSIFNEDGAFCEQRNELAKKMDYKKATENIAELWA